MKKYEWVQNTLHKDLQALKGAGACWVQYRPGEPVPWRAGARGNHEWFVTEAEAKLWVEAVNALTGDHDGT